MAGESEPSFARPNYRAFHKRFMNARVPSMARAISTSSATVKRQRLHAFVRQRVETIAVDVNRLTLEVISKDSSLESKCLPTHILELNLHGKSQR